MSQVIHFEVFVDDVERAKKFYGDVLGWAFKDMGDAMGGYVLVFPGGEITDGPAKAGINGGMLKRANPAPSDDKAAPNAFVCTVIVDNVDATVEKAVAHGGRLDMEANDVPGVGRLAYIRDSEMNLVGLLTPAEGM